MHIAIAPECFTLLTGRSIAVKEAIPAPIVKETTECELVCHSAGTYSSVAPAGCPCSDINACCRTTTVGKKTCARVGNYWYSGRLVKCGG